MYREQDVLQKLVDAEHTLRDRGHCGGAGAQDQ